jgi:hypothetical protein
VIPDQDDLGSVPAFAAAYGLRRAGYRGPVSVVGLPPGRDPADATRETLHDLVCAALADPL